MTRLAAWNEDFVDRDVLALIEVDVPDSMEFREWLRASRAMFYGSAFGKRPST